MNYSLSRFNVLPFAIVSLLATMSSPGSALAESTITINDIQLGPACSISLGGTYVTETDSDVTHLRNTGLIAQLLSDGSFNTGFGTRGAQTFSLGDYTSVQRFAQNPPSLVFAGYAVAQLVPASISTIKQPGS